MAIEKWIEKQVVKADSYISIENALLTSQVSKYFLYRIKNYLLIQAIYVFNHLVEFFLLYKFIEHSNLKNTMYVFSACALIQAFWWGGLEKLRKDIRRLKHQNVLYKAPKIYTRWIESAYAITACLLSAAIFLGISLFLWSDTDFYFISVILILCIRLAVQLNVVTIHSVIFSVSRIYMPVYHLVAIELIALVTLLMTSFAFGKWALPVSSLLYTAYKTSFRIYFINRAYESYQWKVPGINLHRITKGIKTIFSNLIFDKLFLIYAFSSLLMGLDLVVLFSLYKSSSLTAENGIEFLAVLFLISPLLRSTHSWAYLFYFDLVKLNLTIFKLLKQKIEHSLILFSIQFGLFFALLAFLFIATAARHINLSELLAVFPAFTVLSLYASLQIRCFSRSAHAALTISGLSLIISCLALSYLQLFPPFVSLFICFSVSYLTLQITDWLLSGNKGIYYTYIFSDWLKTVKFSTGKFLSVIEFSRKAPGRANNEIFQELYEKSGGNLISAYFSDNLIVTAGTEKELQNISGILSDISRGYIASHKIIRLPETWDDKLKLLAAEGVISNQLYSILSQQKDSTSEQEAIQSELKNKFIACFPDGRIIDLVKNRTTQGSEQIKIKPSLIYSIVYFLKYFQYADKYSKEWVSAYCTNGEINLVFIVSKPSTSHKLLAEWKNEILKYSLITV